MMDAQSPLICMKDLGKSFTTTGVAAQVLENINIEIQTGDYVAVSGPSGCGKSTLLSIIGLLDRPTSGTYEISGIDVIDLSDAEIAKVRNREIGLIFQDFNLIGDMTVFQNVELPLVYRGLAKAERRDLVLDCLDKVNMAERVTHFPTELSGGQQQRVAVARAIAGKPALLLADEPTGNLDSKNGDAVMQLLQALNDEGSTIFMVTHDSRYASYARRTLQLFDGKIAAHSETEPAVTTGSHQPEPVKAL